MSGRALTLHSLTEAKLYLMVTPCAHCAAGPLVPEVEQARPDPNHRLLIVPVCCKACSTRAEVSFDASRIPQDGRSQKTLAEDFPAGADLEAAINPTPEPSRVIDVAGWLTLHSILERAAREAGEHLDSPAERAAARQLQRQWAQCLDEALKFYEDGEELPPRNAFFHPASRRQFRDRPELFVRQRVAELRAHARNQPIRRSSH